MEETLSHVTNHFINSEKRDKLISNFGEHMPLNLISTSKLDSSKQLEDNPSVESFDIDQVIEFATKAKKDGATQLSIAQGAHDDLKRVSVIVAYKKETTVSMLPGALQMGNPCPPFCD